MGAEKGSGLTTYVILQDKGQPSDIKAPISLHQQQVDQQMQHSTIASGAAHLEQHLQQQQLQQPLIQEMATMKVTDAGIDQAQQGAMQEAAANGPQSSQQRQDSSQDEQSDIVLVNNRLQALEASSMRMERKVDQILEYCRTLAQAMNPA